MSLHGMVPTLWRARPCSALLAASAHRGDGMTGGGRGRFPRAVSRSGSRAAIDDYEVS